MGKSDGISASMSVKTKSPQSSQPNKANNPDFE